jgi:hypothetical protein
MDIKTVAMVMQIKEAYYVYTLLQRSTVTLASMQQHS